MSLKCLRSIASPSVAASPDRGHQVVPHRELVRVGEHGRLNFPRLAQREAPEVAVLDVVHERRAGLLREVVIPGDAGARALHVEHGHDARQILQVRLGGLVVIEDQDARGTVTHRLQHGRL
jgi:hypothetical protein